jgi:hypothetical protein
VISVRASFVQPRLIGSSCAARRAEKKSTATPIAAKKAKLMFFLACGYRVIPHDRRGHGRSAQTAVGNDMDTCAADVAQLAAISSCEMRSTLDTRRVAARLLVMSPAMDAVASPRPC